MNIKEWPCWAKIGTAVMLVVFVLNWPTSSAEWAAWVQAFGAISAICGAIWISEKSRKELSEREKKAKILEINGVIVLLDQILQTIKQVPNELEDLSKKESFKEVGFISVEWIMRILDNSIVDLKRIPIHLFPYSMLATELGRRIYWLEMIRNFFDHPLADKKIDLSNYDKAFDFLNKAKIDAERELNRLQEIRDEAIKKIVDFY